MPSQDKLLLGDLLVDLGHVIQENLRQALEHQKASGERLGKILVERSLATEQQIAQALASQLDIEFVDLRRFTFDQKIVRRLSEQQARKLGAITLREQDGLILAGMVDPTDLMACDELSRLLGSNLNIAIIAESDLIETLDRIYRRTDEISGLALELSENIGDADIDLDALQNSASIEAAPVVRLLQTIFDDAMRVRASDVHVEPMESRLRIRFRIDGALQLQTETSQNISAALVQRLKLISRLNISERRLPQDGRFNIRIRDEVIDVRVSTMPSQYGESVVLRLLNRNVRFLSLNRLGMPEELLQRSKRIIQRSEGMVLVTGPTGSGKTTSLYAALAEINTMDRKIITVEDPVEYHSPGITQVQINDKIDLSFARVLRSFLRQDPDVILVGEMRDPETAHIGLRAAITGHLVFSTLHTRDAAGSLSRLADMGVPKYMLASSVQVVLAQRLLRKICDNCMQPCQPNAAEAQWLTAQGIDAEQWHGLRYGKGCSHCNNTGFSGRIGVYEMLEMNRQLIDALSHQDATEFTRVAEQQMEGNTLIDDAIRHLKAGKTSLPEVIRIVSQVSD